MGKIEKIYTDESTNFQGYKLDENGVPVFESLQIGSVSLKSQTDGTVVLTDKTTGQVKSTLEINRDSEQAVTKVFGNETIEDASTAFQPYDINTFTANVFDEGREQWQMQFDLQADSDRHTVAYRSKSTTGLENVRVLIYSITNQDPTGTDQEKQYKEIVTGQWWMTKSHIWSTRKKDEVVYERGRKEEDSYVSPYDLVPDANEYVSIDVDVTYEAGHYYRVLVCADNAFDLKGLDNTIGDPINGGTQFFLYTERTYRDIQKITGQSTLIQFLPEDTIDFERDHTNTTIIADNGDSFPVNSIQAINVNGTISIVTSKGGKVKYQGINHENINITGSSAGNTVSGVVDALNALFQVTPLGLGGDYVSTLPTLEGVDITANFAEGQDPIGDSIYGVGTSTGQHDARVWSDETIDELGEFYEVKITGKGQFMLGLYSVDNGDLAEIENNVGNGHSGYLWAQAFYNYGSYVAPWTYYGSNSSSSIQEGWTGATTRQFRYNTIIQDNLANANPDNPVLFKVGINSQGYISCWYFDEGRSNEYIMTSRSSYTLPEGQYGLLVKLVNGTVQLIDLPERTAVDPTAPILTYYYIESPDSNFEYPLFSTQEEADYYDSLNGGTGSGSSHTHIYEDDPTQTVWWMPENGSEMNGTVAPSNTSEITYNSIATEADSLHAPTAFSNQTITVNEGDALNLQLHPTGMTGFTTTIGGIPAWTLVNGYLQGTAPDVSDDNVANPSDTTTVTVYRTNEFGTSQGTLTIVINNLTPPTVDVTGANHEGPATLTGSVANASTWFSLDESLSAGERLIVKGSFLEDIFSEMNNLDDVIIGLKASTWSNTDDGYSYGDESTTGIIDNFKIRLYKNQNGARFAQLNHNNNTVALGSPQFNAGVSMANMNLFFEITGSGNNIRGGWSYGNDSLTHVTTLTYGDFPTTNANKAQTGDQGFGITSADLMVWWNRNATTAGDFDYDEVDWTALTEQSVPVADVNTTSWTKAIDFSGSNERLKQVSTSTSVNAIRMTGIGQTATANSDLTKTSNDTYSRPWATSIVFKSDNNNSNQHIWNSGEGSGSSDDNIYLRTDSSGNLYFGWGRDGALNECKIATNISSNIWYGVYIASKGQRFNGSNATSNNLSNAFDIYIMSSSDSFAGLSSNLSTTTNWNSGSTGGRMDRTILGDFTIGGRGGNRNFHGKVARMIITTLRRNVTMPDTTEIEMMITDPKQWVIDYKNGKIFRYANSTSEATFRETGRGNTENFATIDLPMGDGANDALMSNGIRNLILPTDQNYTKFQGISLVSNDEQTVNINGLS
tara:strand:+ start:2324 stop:6214 length:3891 start_codon:yes stop_codon:yes gene_type:complete